MSVTLLAAGCPDNATLTPVADLYSPPDLSSLVDMSAPPDLSVATDMTATDSAPVAFCKGTGVAGTCAQAYFESVALCFMPGGTCKMDSSKPAQVTCWQSGATFTNDTVNGNPHAVWRDGAQCMEATVTMVNGAVTFEFTTGGGNLALELVGGGVTCPDQTKVNIGGNFGGCKALEDLITVPMAACSKDTCP